MDAPLHSIDAVVRRTGLSAHVIRIWEKRYRAVEPVRTATNRRQYSDEQIERLALLRDLARAGHSIGFVAKLPTERLRLLASTPAAPTAPASAPARSSADPATALLDDALSAVRAMDARALEATLKRAHVALGIQGLLQRVAAPLARALGELWRDGGLTAAHEHFATAVLRSYLARAARPFAAGTGEPVLVVATPSGQLHEVGALLAASLATNVGWQVVYLGASLPAAEIAGAAIQNGARAVALSLVYPEDDPHLEPELLSLRELLPPEIALVAGGRAASSYRAALERVGAFQAGELIDLGEVLDRLRRTAPPQPSRRPGRT